MPSKLKYPVRLFLPEFLSDIILLLYLNNVYTETSVCLKGNFMSSVREKDLVKDQTLQWSGHGTDLAYTPSIHQIVKEI